MKTVTTIILSILLVTGHAQTDNYQVILDSAKMLFKNEKYLNQEQIDKFDYNQIVSMLERVIELNPESSEARYFLGYAYSRINSRDGRGMIEMDLDLVYKSSEQFEKVNYLTPKYSGEIIVLDPYSKLTGEWGSMAMKYWYNNKADSAKWAFKEGKRRGAFGSFILNLNKKVLDACGQNAILISSGDNFSIPLWYLQIVENYRPDVSVVDISLLNTSWYPAYLSQKKSVSFDLEPEVLDTIGYIKCNDTTITIKDFSWTVIPSYYDKYLFRGDRVFLSLLKENEFQKDLYFTIGFNEVLRLSLKEYLKSFILIDKLVVSENLELDFKDYKKSISGTLKLSKDLNLNSPDELRLLDNFRFITFDRVNDYLKKGDKKKAKKLMKIFDKYAPRSKYPYQGENGMKYETYLREKI